MDFLEKIQNLIDELYIKLSETVDPEAKEKILTDICDLEDDLEYLKSLVF